MHPGGLWEASLVGLGVRHCVHRHPKIYQRGHAECAAPPDRVSGCLFTA